MHYQLNSWIPFNWTPNEWLTAGIAAWILMTVIICFCMAFSTTDVPDDWDI